MAANPKITSPKDRLNISPLKFVLFIIWAVVFVLNLLNIVPWSIWSLMVRFWPVLLIMIVFQYFGKRKLVANLIVFALGFGLTIALLFLTTSSVSRRVNKLVVKYDPYFTRFRKTFGIESGDKIATATKITDENLGEYSFRKFDFNFTKGKVKLTESEDNYVLYTDENYYQNYGIPSTDSKVDNGILNISYKLNSKMNTFLGTPTDISYDILIGSSDIQTSMFVFINSADLEMQLNKTKLTSLGVGIGSGTANVYLGGNSIPRIMNLSIGAGNMYLEMPLHTFAKINYDLGLGFLQINDKKLTRVGSYTTRNFSITEDPIEINVRIDAGSIIINTTGEN